MSNRALTVAAVGMLLASGGCGGDVPSDQAFAAGASADSTGDGGLGGAEATDGGIADSGVDTARATDDGLEAEAAGDDGGTGGGATAKRCGDVLKCVLEAKSWTPGKPVPADTQCTKGLAGMQGEELDALLGCADNACSQEVDAWDKGGDATLPALYACLIDGCAKHLAVCLGGAGKGNCAAALKCLGACTPTDRACTLPCIEDTTAEQSTKAGAVLECALKACGGLPKLPACDIPFSCGLKCPELAGG